MALIRGRGGVPAEDFPEEDLDQAELEASKETKPSEVAASKKTPPKETASKRNRDDNEHADEHAAVTQEPEDESVHRTSSRDPLCVVQSRF